MRLVSDMTDIPWFQGDPTPHYHAFQTARGEAIDTYASLEQSLSHIFGHASGTPLEVAGAIYFRISSSRSRLAIIERLMEDRHQALYRPFLRPLLNRQKFVDQTRNQVVHWRRTMLSAEQGSVYALQPPSWWKGDVTHFLYTPQLEAFIIECNFWSVVLSIFHTHLTNPELFAQMPESSSPDIFQQPISYPLPADHPLSHWHVEHHTSPQSSHV
jgi:hypothetical protein